MDRQKVTVAEVLHLAADEFLHDGSYFIGRDTNLQYASCFAVEAAIEEFFPIENKQSRALCEIIMKGLQNMGLDTDYANFREFDFGTERQGARYAWLKFAAMIAEEQGI